MTKISIFSTIAFLGAFLLIWTNTACDQKEHERKIAELYCGSCHLFPEPTLLDKKNWTEGVLPQMAIRMGLVDPDFTQLDPEEYQKILEKGGLPQKAMISQSDWDKIVNYYLTNAPDQIATSQKVLPITMDTQMFRPTIVWQSPGQGANFSLLKYFPQQKTLITGQREGKVRVYRGQNLYLEDSLILPSPASDIHISKQGHFQLVTMGNMDPNDAFNGALFEIDKINGRWEFLQRWSIELNRPVQFSISDLNQDGEEDFIISEFGHYLGGLSWQEKTLEGKTKVNLLYNAPGARIAQVVDLDRDGKQDIVALFAQGDEKIVWFKNLGGAVFEQHQLARFPPIYGSSYLEIRDINQDGKLDLIHSAGDNYDYSYALKKYHGIRILLNQGDQTFQEKKFLPLYGAGKVLVEDFDQDGQLDLACTAYFPDYAQKPLAGFVLYKNKGNLNFSAHTFPMGDAANWLLMDKGDVDQDGDCDIVLGACSINNTVPKRLRQTWNQQGIGVLLFKNQLK